MGDVTLDAQILISFLGVIITVLLIGPLGWIMRSGLQDLRKLQTDFNDHKEMLSIKYVTRREYENDVHEIKDLLHRIFDKLDGKEDKKP